MKFQAAEILSQLPFAPNAQWPDGVPFTEVFSRNSLSLEFFAPRGEDYQTPHERDELYIVASGRAVLTIAGERFGCGVGDALFVPKQAIHKFSEMTDDFGTWVIFF